MKAESCLIYQTRQNVQYSYRRSPKKDYLVFQILLLVLGLRLNFIPFYFLIPLLNIKFKPHHMEPSG